MIFVICFFTLLLDSGNVATGAVLNPRMERFIYILPKDALNETAVSDGAREINMGEKGVGFNSGDFAQLNKELLVEGVPFFLQRTERGFDHYVPNAENLQIPEKTKRIYILATRVFGGGKNVANLIGENGISTAPLFISDWCTDAGYNEKDAFRMPHRIVSGEKEMLECHLWAISMDIPQGTKQIRFSPDKDLHIFAITADLKSDALWTTSYELNLADRIPPLSLVLPPPQKAKGDLHLGFVAHWSRRGLERYDENSAHSMLMNLLCWRMRDCEKQLVDFSGAEKWLAYLYRIGIQAALIIDTSIHHTSISWRSEITKNLGENVAFQNGEPSQFSSPFSPQYQKMIRQYIEDVTGWVKKHDTAHKVRTYVNGAEVFWPGLLDYGNLAKIEFRKWLKYQYGDLERINERWGADFKNWEDVNPIPFYRFGRLDFAPTGFFYENWPDASWTITIPNLKQGEKYKVMVDVKSRGVHEGRAQLEIAWQQNGALKGIEVMGCAGDTKGEWRHIEKLIRITESFDKAVLQMTLESQGETWWKNPGVFPENENQNLIPDNPEDNRWNRSPWNGNPVFDITEDENKNKLFFIKFPAHEHLYEYDSAAWYDFVTFCMETYALQMNDWAKYIKKCDPSREVMHYLGFTLGMLGQWDDAALTQRADIFLSKAPDVDINGIQLCAANGDFHYSTIVIDLARKYGKPMIATDLQDFTHGVYAGFNKLNRLGLACIAHGMDGMYYYDWLGTKDYDWYENWEMEDTRRMIENAEKAIRFLENFELQTDVAFIMPILPYCEADPGGQKNDMFDSMGLYKIVAKLGFCPDVYTLYELTTQMDLNLNRYTAIFMPDCLFINRNAIDALSSYVKNGGNLVISGRIPRFDETGRELKPFLVPPGMKASGKRYHKIAKGKGWIVFTEKTEGRDFLGHVRRYRVAGNTPPLFQQERDSDSITPDESAIIGTMREIVTSLDLKPFVRLDPPDPMLEYVVYKKEDELRMILINTSSNPHKGGSVVFSVKGSEPEIFADFEPAKIIPSQTKTSGTIIPLPPFTDCCTIVLF